MADATEPAPGVPDWHAVGADRIVLTCRGIPTRTPAYLGHAVREAGRTAAYEWLGVPRDHRLALAGLAYRTAASPDGYAGDLVVDVARTDTSHRRGALWELGYDVTVRAGERTLGTGSGRLRFLPPSLVRFIQGAAGPPPESGDEPAAGAGAADGGLLQRAGGAADADGARWLLRVPQARLRACGVVDHVPGIVLVEAAEQAATSYFAPAPVLVRRCVATFARFVSPTAASLVAACPAGDGVEIRVTQDGAEMFRAEVAVDADVGADPTGG
jgi:2-oxo-3-(phosphooxy)propyl 3-oxoalkanoate synthase